MSAYDVRAGGAYMPPTLYNVRIGDEDIASGVTKEQADQYRDAWRVKPCGTLYIYLSDKPLECRKAAWKPAALLKPWPKRWPSKAILRR